MYAIVEIAGQQFKVKRGDKVISHRLAEPEGRLVEFDKVLLIDNNGKVQVGTPTLTGAKVAATVVSHFRGEKLIIFKKKRRKGYQKWNGHRQELTELLIQGILPEGGTIQELLEVKKNRTPEAKNVLQESAKTEEPENLSKASKKETSRKKRTSSKKKSADSADANK